MFRQTLCAILLRSSKTTTKSQRREAQPQSRKMGFMFFLRGCLRDLRVFAVVLEALTLLGASHALAQPAATTTTTTTSPGPINLLRNGGFEEPGGKLAMHWEPLVIG